MNSLKIVGLFMTLICLSSGVAHARKPAVLPVTSISIDQYNDVPPSKAKGYDWNNNKNAVKTITTKKPVARTPAIQRYDFNQTKTSGPSIPVIAFLILMFGLPMALWWGIMKGLDQPEETNNAEDVGSVVDLKSERAKRESNSDNDDDINYPKAG
jgi:hypothetical protein